MSGKGESNIGWPMLVPKACSTISYGGLSLVVVFILGSEFEIVVRSDNGMRSMYSPSSLSPSDKEKRDS